jgi:hypothetical protein
VSAPVAHAHARVVAAAVLFLPGGLSPTQAGSGQGASAEELASHRRMLERLEEIRRQTPETNAYLGDAALRKLDEALAEAESLPLKSRAKLEHDKGMQLLRLGRNEQAVALLSSCHERLSRLTREDWPPFAERLEYHLGLAHLRVGVTNNCLAMRTALGCLVPIARESCHPDARGARAALEWFRRALRAAPDGEPLQLCSKWLLNLAAQAAGEYPDGLEPEERLEPAVFTSALEFPRFPEVAGQLGLNELDLCGGAVIDDFDGDGRLDVMSSSWDTGSPLVFFVNRGGGRFERRTREANLEGINGGLNLVQADHDDDGDLDLLVLRGAWLFGPRGCMPKSLLENQGGASFLDVSYQAGVAGTDFPSQAAAWADYDLDGDLDLYLGAEASAEAHYPGQLLQNRGDGTYEDVAQAAGVQNLRFAKGVSWGDCDQDRYPELFVSNLGGKNRLYANRRDGTFSDRAAQAGVELPLAGFACWFWDFDNDGLLDLYCASYDQGDQQSGLRLTPVVAGLLGLPQAGELGRLYRGDGRGSFTDVTEAAGLRRPTLPMGANFGDLDNDGFLDFYLGTGYPHYDGLIPNVMYWNRGGKEFADVSFAGGFALLAKGHGVSFADLDDDGDQDVFEQLGGAYPGDPFVNVLFQNPGFGRHWLKVRLVGRASNRSALGARIRAEFLDGTERRSVTRWVTSGGSFGCNPLQQHLGLGAARQIERLEVFWPRSELLQEFRALPVDVRLEIVEGEPEPRVLPAHTFALGS